MSRIQPIIRGTLLNQSHVLARGPVCYLPLNEGCGRYVWDLSRRRRNWFISPFPTWISGRSGHALNIAGGSIDVGDDVYKTCDNGLTIITKFRWNGGGELYGRICDKYPGSSIVLHRTAGGLRYYGKIGGTTRDVAWNTATAVVDEWAVWAFRLGNNFQEVYKNGHLADDTLGGGPYAGTYEDGGAVHLFVGDRTDGNRSVNGRYECFYVFNYPMSVAEIVHISRELNCLTETPTPRYLDALRFVDIPPFMEKNLINPFASGAWLWLVQIAVPGQATVRIARNTADLHYDGEDFDKFNLQIGEQVFSGDGSIPRVTLRTFQDISRQIEDIINETEGALGGQVKLIRVNEKWITTPVAALEADYDLLASESNSEWCTFTLGIPNPLTQRFPLEDFSSSMCPWTSPELFKGPECQYPDGDPTCTGTYHDCHTKGNAVHWGGELGLSPSVVKERRR